MGSREIIDLNQGGVSSATRSSTRYDRNLLIATGREEVDFGARGVDSIQYDVRFVSEEDFV